ncbi:hypothetical protein [Bacillus cereus]|uniref:hypothetical protein n=1 Tax=Bacillus cereus TaxID=1396 RepID=UPI000539488B|nr:hypothetical protein [Bacillus cereus]
MSKINTQNKVVVIPENNLINNEEHVGLYASPNIIKNEAYYKKKGVKKDLEEIKVKNGKISL